MGISERKERERLEMKQRITSAAMNMFLQEGYERTSIRNIAEKIEYSPATIYLYYKDKDELLYEVQHEAFAKLDNNLNEFALIQNPFDRLRAIGKTYIEFALNNPELYDLMFILKAPMKSIKEEADWSNCDDSYAFVLKTVSECMAAGLIRFNDVNTAAFSVWSMAHGIASLFIRDRMKVTDATPEESIQLVHQSMNEYMELIRA